MDKDVLGDRAYFHSEKTGSFTSDGVEILHSYLQINKVNAVAKYLEVKKLLVVFLTVGYAEQMFRLLIYLIFE